MKLVGAISTAVLSLSLGVGIPAYAQQEQHGQQEENKDINLTVDQYRAFLEEVRHDRLVLPNTDLDSGQPTKAAEYTLTDEAYAKLLAQLSDRKFDLTSPELRDNILQFYSDPSTAIETKRDAVRWQNVLTSLDQLRSVAPVAAVGASPAQ